MRVGRGETNTIFCDVDGTLLIWRNSGSPSAAEKEWLRLWMTSGAKRMTDPDAPRINKALVERLLLWDKRGGKLVIWSGTGLEHAQRAAVCCGLAFATCVAKPDLIIDDSPEGFKAKLPSALPSMPWPEK